MCLFSLIAWLGSKSVGLEMPGRESEGGHTG